MIEVRPLRRCDGAVTVPGSKSYTHRVPYRFFVSRWRICSIECPPM